MSPPQRKYMSFHISKIFIHLDVYLDPIHWPAPSWLVSSIGRVLHRYPRGHGFKSRAGLNLFRVLFTTTRFSSVLCCEDLLISCLHRSANIWVFIYLKSSSTWMFIWTQFIDQLPVGLSAQLVECCTGIPEVMGSNPVRAWIFFGYYLQLLVSVVFFAARIS